MLADMREGAVIVDVSVDQGGCVETSKPTTHQDPVYTVDGVVHYGVANMPGAVPFTSTIGLTNATLPYALRIANNGYEAALRDDAGLREGLNVINGTVTYKGVADAFDMEYVHVDEVLGSAAGV
jgi:alanine dehydrogenase